MHVKSLSVEVPASSSHMSILKMMTPAALKGSRQEVSEGKLQSHCISSSNNGEGKVEG